jgi:hypothetical protein
MQKTLLLRTAKAWSAPRVPPAHAEQARALGTTIEQHRRRTGRVVVVHRSRSSCRKKEGGLGRKRSIRRRISTDRGARRYLGQLEPHVAAVAHDPSADEDQLLV